MSSDLFSYKKGMRLPSRVLTLDGNGIASLAELDPGSIRFVYRKKGVAERNEITPTIVDAAARKIRVDFGAIDTNTIAAYQFHVEGMVGGKLLAWPERGFYTFSVTETIG